MHTQRPMSATVSLPSRPHCSLNASLPKLQDGVMLKGAMFALANRVEMVRRYKVRCIKFRVYIKYQNEYCCSPALCAQHTGTLNLHHHHHRFRAYSVAVSLKSLINGPSPSNGRAHSVRFAVRGWQTLSCSGFPSNGLRDLQARNSSLYNGGCIMQPTVPKATFL